MSRPNTRFQETERDDVIPPSTTHPAVENTPVKYPGVALITPRIRGLLDEAYMALADANLANSQDQQAALESHLEKIATLATHARGAVTKARVQERQKE